MAKWDHADLLSVQTKAVLYPEYTDLESLKRYNPDWLLTKAGRARFPNYVDRPYGAPEETGKGKIEVPKATPWWEVKVKDK